MTIPILCDHPDHTDALDFSRYAALLARIVCEADTLPLTLGVFGDWGSGKTTLMKMLQTQVQPTCKTLWFNAWRYDDKEYLSKAFLKTVHDAVWASNELNPALFKDVLERVGNWAGKTLADKPFGSIFFETFSLDPAYQNMLEEVTRDLIDRYVGDDGRLVIFIDDLDRCLPENAITILEALKLYLDHSRCVVVLGVDRQIIETAIHLRYPNLQISGKDYLEKIVQIPFAIPQPGPQLLSRYLDDCRLLNGRKLSELRSLKALLLAGAGLNMRRLKRLVNQLNLAMAIAVDQDWDESHWTVLVKLLVLQTRFSAFFEEVKRRPESIAKFHQLLNAHNEDQRQAVVQAFPQLAPFEDEPVLTAFFRATQPVTCTNVQQVEALLALAAVNQ